MLKKTLCFTLNVLALIAAPNILAQDKEITSNIEDQQQLAVTIYNNNLALIKDQRKIRLNKGLNVLALRDVSAQIRPETALLQSINHASAIRILEQNFDFDLLTPQKLLEKYVGKNVTLVKTNPVSGVETSESASVLSAANGVVLKIGSRIESGIPGRLIYDDVPANLRDRPTLVTKLDSKSANEHLMELSYLSSGLNWKADYVAELNSNENEIDLSGWVTLTNTSGTRYKNAKLQLVAGDVNRVVPGHPRSMLMQKTMDMQAEAASGMSEEALLEYHLYTLDRTSSIEENQTKQISLLSSSNIPARKELVLRGEDYYYTSNHAELGKKLKVGVYLEFDNKESAKLGMPLPKGIVRAYRKDSQGNAQFVGEDAIDHTPKNETVRLKLGNAFDVTADKKQLDFKNLPKPSKNNLMSESAYEIVIKNAKKETVAVRVQEPIPGEWKILKESHPSKKINSSTAEWKINVPAESETVLSYRVQVKN